MSGAALAAFVAGALLLLLVEHGVATIAAIVLLLAAIVAGTFAVASPDYLARSPGSRAGMRVIDCDCGKTLQAANDDDLAKATRRHVDEDHPDMGLSDEQVRDLVAERAYSASDS